MHWLINTSKALCITEKIFTDRRKGFAIGQEQNQPNACVGAAGGFTNGHEKPSLHHHYQPQPHTEYYQFYALTKMDTNDAVESIHEQRL